VDEDLLGGLGLLEAEVRDQLEDGVKIVEGMVGRYQQNMLGIFWCNLGEIQLHCYMTLHVRCRMSPKLSFR